MRHHRRGLAEGDHPLPFHALLPETDGLERLAHELREKIERRRYQRAEGGAGHDEGAVRLLAEEERSLHHALRRQEGAHQLGDWFRVGFAHQAHAILEEGRASLEEAGIEARENLPRRPGELDARPLRKRRSARAVAKQRIVFVPEEHRGREPSLAQRVDGALEDLFFGGTAGERARNAREGLGHLLPERLGARVDQDRHAVVTVLVEAPLDAHGSLFSGSGQDPTPE